VILSVFYTPAATDLDRYRTSPGSPSAAGPPACSSSCRRPPIACWDCFDFVFLVPELLLLLVAINSATGA
jgi:hypothetical protein